MSDLLRIRSMSLADVDAVAAVSSSLPLAPQWSRFVFAEALRSLGLPSRVSLIAEVEGTIAGFAVASFVPPEAELESIAVGQRWQRRGVARKLLESTSVALAQAGAESITLEVRASNTGAIKLYRSFGFEDAGVRKLYYQCPPEDALVMRFYFSSCFLKRVD